MSQIPPLKIIQANIKSLTRFVFLSSILVAFGALPWVTDVGSHVLGVLITLGIASAVYLVALRRIFFSSVLLLLLSWGGATALVLFSGGLGSPFLIVLLAPALIGTIFLGRIGAAISVALSALSLAAIYLLGIGDVRIPHLIQYDIPNQFVILGMSFFIIFGSNLLLSNTLELTADLEESYDQTLAGWARALEFRDGSTREHSERVVELSYEMAKRFEFTRIELQNFRRGALLHDIGKIGVSDRILLKPGLLNDDERKEMQKHPLIAKEMLGGIEFLSDCLAIPTYHHERWDGSGYPYGLKGKEIPIEARIFSIVDVWDALTSDRPYRKKMSEPEALGHITKGRGELFDPEVTDIFFEFLKSKNLLKVPDKT
jgi:hypothetical protein